MHPSNTHTHILYNTTTIRTRSLPRGRSLMKKDDRWPFDPGKAAALRKQLKDAQAEIVCAARDTLTNLGLQLTSHARSLRNEDDDPTA